MRATTKNWVIWRTTDRSAIDGVLVLKNGVEDRRVGEYDEPESSGATGGLVVHDYDLSDVAVVAEVVSEFVLRGFPCYASHE